MERLTERRGGRTWRLFRVGWYFNLVLVVGFLLLAAHFLIDAQVGAGGSEETRNIILMVTMLIVASVLLMGAGVSRYEARLEGQHLELKLAIKRLEAEVEEFKKREP